MGIVTIYGKVNFSITLDPGVWIFDDRKVDLETYFVTNEKRITTDTNKAQTIAKQWEEGIAEGVQLHTEKLSKREELVSKSYAIPFQPFLNNAEPHCDATKLVIEYGNQQEEILSLKEANSLLLGFSYKGKPLADDGPVHVYFGDGSNKEKPLKNVKNFRII